MFTFGDALAGNGFLAGVTLSGRALMVRENDREWWLYGVCPGSIAETGATPQETYLRFRTRYREILFDIAAEAPDFKSFKYELERFFVVDQSEEGRWMEAFQAIRSGKLEPEAPFAELPKARPESWPCKVEIQRLDEAKQFRASDNVSDAYALPAAA